MWKKASKRKAEKAPEVFATEVLECVTNGHDFTDCCKDVGRWTDNARGESRELRGEGVAMSALLRRQQGLPEGHGVAERPPLWSLPPQDSQVLPHPPLIPPPYSCLPLVRKMKRSHRQT